MEINDEKSTGVMVLVLNRNKDKALFGKRINCFAAGTYGIPGGRIRKNEKIEKAAERELKEETGLISLKTSYIGVVRDVYFDHTFIHFAFLCSSFKGEVKTMEPDKCLGWKWHSFNKLPKNTFPAHKTALNIYLDSKLGKYQEIFNSKNLVFRHDR